MRQYKKIFALLKSINQSNDWLHDMLLEWFDKKSLKELTVPEVQTVIFNLEKLNASNKKPDGLTDKQLRKIGILKSKLNMSTADLNKFNLHTTGIENINDLTIKKGSALIIGMVKLYLSRNCKKLPYKKPSKF